MVSNIYYDKDEKVIHVTYIPEDKKEVEILVLPVVLNPMIPCFSLEYYIKAEVAFEKFATTNDSRSIEDGIESYNMDLERTKETINQFLDSYFKTNDPRKRRIKR